MTKDYSKNFTSQGYLMNYYQGPKTGPMKNIVLQFKIELIGIEPLIWRRIQVPSYYNFWDLHVAIQDAMGWQDYHLHSFEIKGKRKKKTQKIGIPDFHQIDDSLALDPGWEIPVTDFFNDLGVTAQYLYDFGDYWEHAVLLEGYIVKDTEMEYPLCVAGERACPPEDCGGVPGYFHMLNVLSNPADEEYEDMRMWLGGNWKAEYFDAESVKFDDPYFRWIDAFRRR